jgi:hypothetical protein
MTAAPEAYPTLVATVDPIEVASRITTHGARGAIQASTVEILALADRLIRLATLADLTADMLATADLALAQNNPETRRALTKLVRQKISDVGASLEALGYGQPQTTPSSQENVHGQS